MGVVRVEGGRRTGCLSWKEILYRILWSISDLLTAIKRHATVFETTCSHFNISLLMKEETLACDWILIAHLLHYCVA